MDNLPDTPRDTSFDHLDLTSDELDEYLGFIEFIESDMFNEWLIDTLGEHTLNIRQIVSALIHDGYFGPSPSGAYSLPPELYSILRAQMSKLIDENILKRKKHLFSIRPAHRRQDITQLDEQASDPANTTERPQMVLDALEQRISAAHLGTRAVSSCTPNKTPKSFR